jgi:hypothetical protein
MTAAEHTASILAKINAGTITQHNCNSHGISASEYWTLVATLASPT